MTIFVFAHIQGIASNWFFFSIFCAFLPCFSNDADDWKRMMQETIICRSVTSLRSVNRSKGNERETYQLDTWAHAVHRWHTGSRLDNARLSNSDERERVKSTRMSASYFTRRVRCNWCNWRCGALTERTTGFTLGKSNISGTDDSTSKWRTLITTFTHITIEQIFQIARWTRFLTLFHRWTRLTFAEKTSFRIDTIAETTIQRALKRLRAIR